MTRCAFFIGLCLSLSATVAGADEDKAVAKAAKALQATWEVRKVEIDGQRREWTARRTFGMDGTYKMEIMGTVVREGNWKVVAVKDKVVHIDMTVNSIQQTVLS